MSTQTVQALVLFLLLLATLINNDPDELGKELFFIAVPALVKVGIMFN